MCTLALETGKDRLLIGNVWTRVNFHFLLIKFLWCKSDRKIITENPVNFHKQLSHNLKNAQDNVLISWLISKLLLESSIIGLKKWAIKCISDCFLWFFHRRIHYTQLYALELDIWLRHITHSTTSIPINCCRWGKHWSCKL